MAEERTLVRPAVYPLSSPFNPLQNRSNTLLSPDPLLFTPWSHRLGPNALPTATTYNLGRIKCFVQHVEAVVVVSTKARRVRVRPTKTISTCDKDERYQCSTCTCMCTTTPVYVSRNVHTQQHILTHASSHVDHRIMNEKTIRFFHHIISLEKNMYI